MHPELAGVVRGFADAASASLGTRLCSVIVYGDALENAPARHDTISLLVVADAFDLAALAALAKPLAQARRLFDLAPVFFTRDEMSTSRDVFPIELMQMQGAYEVVAGVDVLADLSVEREDLRMQLEEDLKTKRLWLRQRVAEGTPPEQVARETFAGLPAVFAGLLRFREARVPSTVEGLLDAVSRTFSLDAELLGALLGASRRRSKAGAAVAQAWLAGLAATLDQLVAAVEG